MVGYWSQKWSNKVKKHVCPEMTQKGLETVPIASGGPGSGFYNIITSFYIKKEPFFPINYYPYPPVKFLILALLNDDDDDGSHGAGAFTKSVVDWKRK